MSYNTIEDEALKAIIKQNLCNLLRLILFLDDIFPRDIVISVIADLLERLCQQEKNIS